VLTVELSALLRTQALKEEGIEVVLINPNIATVQTSKHLGRSSPDVVYFLPITRQVSVTLYWNVVAHNIDCVFRETTQTTSFGCLTSSGVC
jgi:carbamoylphosphate synthase large subunit